MNQNQVCSTKQDADIILLLICEITVLEDWKSTNFYEILSFNRF